MTLIAVAVVHAKDPCKSERCLRKEGEKAAREIEEEALRETTAAIRQLQQDLAGNVANAVDTYNTRVEAIRDRYPPFTAAPFLGTGGLGNRDAHCGSQFAPEFEADLAHEYGRYFTICVDATNGKGLALTGFAHGQYLHPLPHQFVRVLVAAGSDDDISVTGTGVNGIWQPAMRSELAPPGTAGATEQEASVGLGVYVLPPYLPGKLAISVERHAKAADPKSVRTALDELRTLIATDSRLALAPKATDVWTAATGLEAKLAVARLADEQSALDAIAARLDAVTATERATLLAAAQAVGAARTPDADGAVDPSAVVVAEDAARASAEAVIATLRTEVETLTARTELLALADATLPIPLEVDRTYAGDLRTGVAVVGYAVDRSYGVRSADAADGTTSRALSEEGSTDQLPLEAELVLGYSNYVGRRPSSSTDAALALFAATGLAAIQSDGTTSVTAFRSFGVGVELGNQHFALGLGPAVRRITRLQADVEVGDPLPAGATAVDGTIPGFTREQWTPGLQLVVFAPSLFKVGKTSAAPAAPAPPTPGT